MRALSRRAAAAACVQPPPLPYKGMVRGFPRPKIKLGDYASLKIPVFKNPLSRKSGQTKQLSPFARRAGNNKPGGKPGLRARQNLYKPAKKEIIAEFSGKVKQNSAAGCLFDGPRLKSPSAEKKLAGGGNRFYSYY